MDIHKTPDGINVNTSKESQPNLFEFSSHGPNGAFLLNRLMRLGRCRYFPSKRLSFQDRRAAWMRGEPPISLFAWIVRAISRSEYGFCMLFIILTGVKSLPESSPGNVNSFGPNRINSGNALRIGSVTK